MQDFLLSNYEWLRALHIISVISWMAGMLYLPRLFVYHCDAEKGSIQSETFKIMERRLLKFIINPAMISSWLFGLSMIIANPGMLQGQGWLHAKLLLVLILSGVHGMFANMTKRFARDENTKPARYYRIMNEVPTILMIFIVILAVVQPF
ncbi:MAG: protoporphyrinogen oxidase HemJ [Alphaproteobacteria bacterium]|nr:protoporphyrinogen oxidase HemJ [Alphaproteobacteria bacterium]